MINKRSVKITPPEDFSDLKLHDRKEKAAGIPAVISSLQHLEKELGVFKGIRILNKMNQKDGFDCPGCAWPDPDGKRSRLGEYCENGVKALAEEATEKRVDPAFFEKHSVEELSGWTDYALGKAGRITQPMYLAKGASKYIAISWDEAYERIADHLKSLNSPDEGIFYTSGRTSNEAAFLYQLFVRSLGTNNLPDCSNMCHESSGVGLSETVGIGKGSVTLEDLHIADLIVVMGQNPGTNHPRMLSALTKCKKNGGTIVSINPIPEAGLINFVDPQSPVDVLTGGTHLTDQYLQVKINGDVALLKATMWLMLQEEKKSPGSVFDLDFIKEKCVDYEAFLQELENVDFEEAVKASGVSEASIRKFAQTVISKKNVIVCWAMGLTQHANGVQNIREVVNLLLLKGSIGKPGAGTCPVRGHSNVQGDRTMGIWEKPKPEFLDRLEENFGIVAPREHGHDVVEAIRAMKNGQIRFFMAMGGNFISATPDSQLTGEAVQNCELTVQVSTKLNRSHVVTGDEAIILPCLSRSELDHQVSGPQFVSVENSMGVVHSSEGSFEPASDFLRSEPAILCELAHTVLGDKFEIAWLRWRDNYDLIRDNIERTIPGFEDYNQRVRQPGGFYLPNGARNGEFNTDRKKAVFTVNPIPESTVPEDHFILMTIRTHDQYNTTIYGMDDRYRGIENERRVLLMNQSDMENRGFRSEDVVHLKSFFKGEERHARNFKVIPYDIAKGCLATYFPEANALVHIDNVAGKSNTPASKFVEVEVYR